ncbi:MAG: MgtC/SapB family protein [Akkermansiaceae bacterium]
MNVEKFMQFDCDAAVSSLIFIAAAYLLSLPIGWNREVADRSAGIRTFPLIGVATCAFALLAGGLAEASALPRIVGAVITGLGFLGGGVILKQDNKVSGMSTAVSIWVTGAIGLSTGLGRIEIALMLSVVCYLSLRYGKVVK